MPDTPGHDPSTVGPRFEEVVLTPRRLAQWTREYECSQANRQSPRDHPEAAGRVQIGGGGRSGG